MVSHSSLELMLAFFGALTLRILLMQHPHSGDGHAPLYGDYEAQRHWQEITLNLPLAQWYHNGTDNDLQYWGLDYPPLTAYHSLAMGYLAKMIDPSFVELHSSRGKQDSRHKLFMRLSVLACDALIFLPAVILLSAASRPRRRLLMVAFIAFYPGLMLIDNGHFQYNNVSLGLFIAALYSFAEGQDLFGSISFVLSLNYKQMELYHALPIFFYLLSKCWHQPSWYKSLYNISSIGAVVIMTFLLLWWPFMASMDSFIQVLHRIFPFARGLFEDKVANFWCSLNIVYKIKQNARLLPWMPTLCLTATVLAALPSNLLLLVRGRPAFANLVLATVNTSLAFFLFSFQVHEKSILLVAIPVAIYGAVSNHGRYSTIAATWFLIISTFSMLPLLLKDGLAIPTLALSLIYLIGAHYAGFLDTLGGDSPQSQAPTSRPGRRPLPLAKAPNSTTNLDRMVYALMLGSLLGALGLGIGSCMVTPPAHLPDLWAVLVSVYSAGHFGAFFIYFSWLQWTMKGEKDKRQYVEFRKKQN